MRFAGVQSAGTELSAAGALTGTASGGNASEDYSRFKSVVLPHLDAAYNLAHWLAGNRTDAEDVVQEALLRAFRAINTFAGGSARAWVLSIVRNTAYSWLHKNRPTAVITVEDLEAVEIAGARPSDPDADTPESMLIAQTEAEYLRAAIAALPTPFRETLVLREIEGLDYREIAEATGVPIGTVMSRLARARSRLVAVIGGKSMSDSAADIHPKQRRFTIVKDGESRCQSTTQATASGRLETRQC
jgi:RNA polymerase sigma-70 factor (ECF subfamily)